MIWDFRLQKTVGPNSGCVLRGARCALRVADSRISGFALALMIGRIIWGSVKLQILAEYHRNFNGAKSFDIAVNFNMALPGLKIIPPTVE